MDWWNSYIGIPFVNKGRERDGLDCWGLFKIVYEDRLSIFLPSYITDYTEAGINESVNSTFTEGLKKGWSRADIVREYDLVILTLAGKPFHCGIVTKPGFMLHVMRGCNSIVESYTGRMWNNRIEGIYHYEF